MDLETLALHGHDDNPLLGGAIAPPIHLSTTFERETDGSYPKGYSYGRSGNPNRIALEQTLAALDGAAAAVTFASGTAATMAVFQSLGSGDHVLVPLDAYYGTRVMLKEIFPRWGLAYDFVDMTDPEKVAAAMRPTTKLVWLETPSNPLLKITDIARTAEIAHRGGALCVADNTVGTSVLQRTLELGCDLAVYSTTKYVSGHSDVIGGAVVAKDDGETLKRLRVLQVHGGAVPSPFDCWLALRGVRTMPHRVRAQSESALKVAEFLKGHSAVTAVHYPGLPTHPRHELARQQMRQFGGLLSFEVRGGEKAAFAAVAGVTMIRRATSLGGVETTMEHRASMEGPGTSTPAALVRVSIGLESATDLIADLRQALDRLS